MDIIVLDGLKLGYRFFQILEMNPEDEAEEDGANIDLDSQRKGKCVVLKTSTRQVSAVGIFSLLLIVLWFISNEISCRNQHFIFPRRCEKKTWF